jgi:hypothetical protein
MSIPPGVVTALLVIDMVPGRGISGAAHNPAR